MKSEVAVRYLRVEEKEIALIERHRFNVKWSFRKKFGSNRTFLQAYLRDSYHTLLNLRWHWVLLLFLLCYILVFTIFALAYWWLGTQNCVVNVSSFAQGFMFSVETMMTIGFGNRYPKSCTVLIVVMTLHSLLGLALDATFIGIVFAKFSKPQNRSRTILFSKNAAVFYRNAVKILAFRIANMRKTPVLQGKVRLLLFNHSESREGEELFDFTPLPLENAKLFLALPTTVFHIISPTSPLYGHSDATWLHTGKELVVVVEGIDGSTSDCFEAFCSYAPEEVMWNFRFKKIVSKRAGHRKYRVQMENFSALEALNLPELGGVTSMSETATEVDLLLSKKE